MASIPITLSDDANNWSDALTLQAAHLVTLSDTMTMTDALNVVLGLRYSLTGDSMAFWNDRLKPNYLFGYALGDDLSNWLDALNVEELGAFSASLASDNGPNWADAIVALGTGQVEFQENLNFWKDNIQLILHHLVTINDDLDNWTDAAGLNAIGAATAVTLASSWNAWADQLNATLNGRFASNTRSEIIPYLRRHLNDVKRPLVAPIRVSLGDSAGNNWNDGIG